MLTIVLIVVRPNKKISWIASFLLNVHVPTAVFIFILFYFFI